MLWYRFCIMTDKSTYISFFEKLLEQIMTLKGFNILNKVVIRLINFAKRQKVSSFESINLKLK